MKVLGCTWIAKTSLSILIGSMPKPCLGSLAPGRLTVATSQYLRMLECETKQNMGFTAADMKG